MWLAPMYEAVLADVRAVNPRRPPGQRVRVRASAARGSADRLGRRARAGRRGHERLARRAFCLGRFLPPEGDATGADPLPPNETRGTPGPLRGIESTVKPHRG